ncbi:MAG: DUF4376 domain-containing protein [Halobacteriota archaeon]
MIEYKEKGVSLHNAIEAAGHWLVQRDNVWESSDDVIVQSIIDAYDPLPERQASKWEDIKAERDRRQVAGVRVGEHVFHSDERSRIQQLGLVMMGANVPPVPWKTVGGAFVTMTQTLANQIFSNTASSDQSIFAAAEVHRVAMMESQDPESYDYSSGWPEV